MVGNRRECHGKAGERWRRSEKIRYMTSCPSPNSPHYQDLLEAGFLIEESGTKIYWSNQKTMELFVDRILAPNFEKVKAELGLPASQKCLWKIDVWSVHRSKSFRDWLLVRYTACQIVTSSRPIYIVRSFFLFPQLSFSFDPEAVRVLFLPLVLVSHSYPSTPIGCLGEYI